VPIDADPVKIELGARQPAPDGAKGRHRRVKLTPEQYDRYQARRTAGAARADFAGPITRAAEYPPGGPR